MENLPGFVPVYGILLVFALLSLGTIGYGIQARANEFFYYDELSKGTVVESMEPFVLCAGPDNVTCGSAYACKVLRTNKNAYGHCVVSGLE